MANEAYWVVKYKKKGKTSTVLYYDLDMANKGIVQHANIGWDRVSGPTLPGKYYGNREKTD